MRKRFTAISAAFVAMVTLLPRAAQADDKIIVSNKCPVPVRFAIHYNPSGSKWRTQGWYIVQPGAYTTLNDARGKYPVIHQKESQLYVWGYAEGRLIHWNQETHKLTLPIRFEGDDLHFLPMDDDFPDNAGDYGLVFSCEGDED